MYKTVNNDGRHSTIVAALYEHLEQQRTSEGAQGSPQCASVQ